eukprot:4665845-Amphidinium_carterae.1
MLHASIMYLIVDAFTRVEGVGQKYDEDLVDVSIPYSCIDGLSHILVLRARTRRGLLAPLASMVVRTFGTQPMVLTM